MKTVERILLLMCGCFIGIYIGLKVHDRVVNKNTYHTIPIEQLDSLRKVYRVNIEVNDIYLHGEIYKIKP